VKPLAALEPNLIDFRDVRLKPFRGSPRWAYAESAVRRHSVSNFLARKPGAASASRARRHASVLVIAASQLEYSLAEWPFPVEESQWARIVSESAITRPERLISLHRTPFRATDDFPNGRFSTKRPLGKHCGVTGDLFGISGDGRYSPAPESGKQLGEVLSPPLYPLTTRCSLGIDKDDFSTAITIRERLRLR